MAMASLVLLLPASLGLSVPSSRGSTTRLPSTLLCLARLRSNDDSLHSGPSSSDWVAKPGDEPSPNAQHPFPSNGSPPAEDVGYLIKLLLGCFAGAATIKYGSVLLPGITRPDLVEGLLMIGLPMVIGVAILLAASFQQRGSGQS